MTVFRDAYKLNLTFFLSGDDDVRAIRSLFPINETDANSGSEENSEDPVTTVKPISKEEGIDEENSELFFKEFFCWKLCDFTVYEIFKHFKRY